jgi:hypothetical protein
VKLRDPDRMNENELDQAVEYIGRQASEKSHDPKIAYQADVFAMVRRIHRTASVAQKEAIRYYIREHQGSDLRPFINSVMGWD